MTIEYTERLLTGVKKFAHGPYQLADDTGERKYQ